MICLTRRPQIGKKNQHLDTIPGALCPSSHLIFTMTPQYNYSPNLQRLQEMYDFSKVKRTQQASVRTRIPTWVSLVPKPTLFPDPLPTRRGILGTLEPQNSGLHIYSVQNMVQEADLPKWHLRKTERLVLVLLTPRKIHPVPRDFISSGVCPPAPAPFLPPCSQPLTIQHLQHLWDLRHPQLAHIRVDNGVQGGDRMQGI